MVNKWDYQKRADTRHKFRNYVGVWISDEHNAELIRMQADGVSRSALIRLAITQFLSRQVGA